jgi:AraC-like DNA-binding protein
MGGDTNHFRNLTLMSPLQLQQSIRLHKVKLILAAQQDAANTTFFVGYESLSRFTLEYKRQFGAIPCETLRTSIGQPRPTEGLKQPENYQVQSTQLPGCDCKTYVLARGEGEKWLDY